MIINVIIVVLILVYILITIAIIAVSGVYYRTDLFMCVAIQ